MKHRSSAGSRTSQRHPVRGWLATFVAVLAFVGGVANGFASAIPTGMVGAIIRAPIGIVSGIDMEGREPIARSTVRLMITLKERKGQCTGSLIAPHLILTAAHCLDAKPLAVSIDFYSGPGRFTSLPARRYLLHPGWGEDRGEERDDLALLYFEGPVPKGHTPIELMAENQFPIGSRVNISGYGMRNVNPDTFQDSDRDDSILRTAPLNVIATEGDVFELKDPAGKASSCFGDSGGPSWIEENGEPILVAVSSRLRPPICMNSSFYTSVTFHREWLSKGSAELTSPAPFRRENFRTAVAPAHIQRLLLELQSGPFDADRLIAFEKFLRRLTPRTGILRADAQKILAIISLDANRLELLRELKSVLWLKSRTDARLISDAFKYDGFRKSAAEVLMLDGIIEL